MELEFSFRNMWKLSDLMENGNSLYQQAWLLGFIFNYINLRVDMTMKDLCAKIKILTVKYIIFIICWVQSSY